MIKINTNYAFASQHKNAKQKKYGDHFFGMRIVRYFLDQHCSFEYKITFWFISIHIL